MQQAPRPPYNTIPDPTADVEGLHRTVLALKQVVEQMTGQRGGPTGGERKPTIHVMAQPPAFATDGDFWFCNTGEFTSLSIRSGDKWLLVWPSP